MANKRKSRSIKTAKNQRITRSFAQKNLFNKPKPRRYSGSYLTLVLMGGAAFFVLKGCIDRRNADNDGDGKFYSSIQQCTEDNNNFSVCVDAWSSARNVFYADIPQQLSQQDCRQQFGSCSFDPTTQRWLPWMSGFLLSRSPRKDKDEHYYSSSGGSVYSSRPVWNDADGNPVRRAGDRTGMAKENRFATRKVTTVSRGGYGYSSGYHRSSGG